MERNDLEWEWWWVDYVEDEFDPSLEGDFRALLENSAEDRETYFRLRWLRAWLAESDPALDWHVESRLGRLRRKVMDGIEETDGDTPELNAP